MNILAGRNNMRKGIIIGICLLSTAIGFAQTNNQPYSIHAIGDITDNIINRTSGLGSTGIAYRNDRWIINNNPAALSGLTNQFFCAEIGVNGQFIDYSGQQVSTTNHTSTDITFKRFAVATKIFRNWGSSIGLVPFSEENYEYAGSRPIGGTGSYLPTYDQGYGGINKVFWANGVELIRNHLSLGLTTSYLFGSINNKNIISGQGTNIYLSKNNNTYFNKVYFDYGLQWYGSVDAHWDYSIGGVFANEQTLRTQTTVNVLNLDSNVLRSTVTSGSYTIPIALNVGFSVERPSRSGDQGRRHWLPDITCHLRRSNYPYLGFALPIWILLSCVAIPTTFLWRQRLRTARVSNSCPHCSYPLSGLPSASPCPECGKNAPA